MKMNPRELTAEKIEELKFRGFLQRCKDGGPAPYGGFGAQCFPLWEPREESAR